MNKSSDIAALSGSIMVLVLSLSILAQSFKLPNRHLSQENSTSTTRTTLKNIIKTCDQAPTMCLLKASPGPHCCTRQCVDLQTSRFHCGKCGAMCRFSEICCGGKCVNAISHEEHCGGCGNRCGLGDSCLYGMCAYAN